jgi:hypothetical protein
MGQIMLKMAKNMRKNLILALCLSFSLLAASAAMASTVTLVGGGATYGGFYVGPIGATLDGTAISGGIACVDVGSESYLNAPFGVTIGTLQPLNLINPRFGATPAAIVKYEEAAWLLGQISSNSAQAAPIQFAVWDIFNADGVDQLLGSGRDKTLENYWLNQVSKINPDDYNFSSVSIYTPTTLNPYGAANQEFMSVGAINFASSGNAVPIPPSFVLLGTALLALAGLSHRKKAALVRGDKQ